MYNVSVVELPLIFYTDLFIFTFFHNRLIITRLYANVKKIKLIIWYIMTQVKTNERETRKLRKSSELNPETLPVRSGGDGAFDRKYSIVVIEGFRDLQYPILGSGIDARLESFNCTPIQSYSNPPRLPIFDQKYEINLIKRQQYEIMTRNYSKKNKEYLSHFRVYWILLLFWKLRITIVGRGIRSFPFKIMFINS